MDDREALELAAGAYGLRHHTYAGDGVGGGMREQRVHGVPHCGYQGPSWNPYVDRGQALLLASRLLLEWTFHESSGKASIIVKRGRAASGKAVRVELACCPDGSDRADVLCRAIVLAAAETQRANTAGAQKT